MLIYLALAALIAWAVYKAIRRQKRGGGCCGEHMETAARVTAADRNRAHYPYTCMLKIGGMTCENCARRVENALNSLEGTWATVDIGTHTAQVRTKQPGDIALLREAVRQAGYVVLP